MTQTLPRSLHSTQTLCAPICGLRPASNAEITSSNWFLSIGQPFNSKSTLTCDEIGVEVASVLMYCGDAYTAATNTFTSAKLRSAWIPPAVAHAPIVIRNFDCRRIL